MAFKFKLMLLSASIGAVCGSAWAAPTTYTVNQNSAPGAKVTTSYDAWTLSGGLTSAYGYYTSEFPSMNDAGVIAGRIPAGNRQNAPISQAAPASNDGMAAIFENGTVKELPFPLFLLVETPGTSTYKNFRLEPIYEARGCKDDGLDGKADNSTCGSRALAINNNGFVAGSSNTVQAASSSYFEKGVLWSDGSGQPRSSVAGKAELMPNLTLSAYAGSSNYQAEGINERRTTVGTGITVSGSGPNDGLTHGLVEYGDGRTTNASVYIGGTNRSSHAHAVNENHDVTGAVYTSVTDARWQMFKLVSGGDSANPTLAGFLPGGGYSEGFAISDGGTIVGAATNSSGQLRAVRWDGASALTDLGTLGGSGTWSVARSINNAGDIVGSSKNASGAERGFIYQSGAMYDLNTYAPVSGWTIVDAYTINANGQILVRATKNGAYDTAYWLLSPNVDQGGTIGTAFNISGNSATPGYIDAASDIDMFKLITPIAGKLTPSTTGVATTVTLLDVNGNPFTTSSTGYDVAPGTYYVKVTSTVIGTYTLNTTWAADDGDTATSATRIDPNSTTAGSIRVAGDVDYFKVYVAATGTLTASTTGTTPTYGKLFYLANGVETEVGSANGGSGNFTLTRSVSPGIYYMKVTHANGGTGTYSLVLSCSTCTIVYSTTDNDDTLETAKALPITALLSATGLYGNFSSTTDLDWYKVTTPATVVNAAGAVVPFKGTLLVHTLVGQTYCYNTPSSNPYGDLYDSTGKILLDSKGKPESGCTENAFLTTYVEGAKTFYVRLRAESGGIGDYQVIASVIQDDVPNNDSEALKIGANATITGDLWYTGFGYDLDKFLVPLKKGTYTWSMSNASAYIMNTDGSSVKSGNTLWTTGTAPISFNVCEDKNYLIGAYNGTGAYTFNGSLVQGVYTSTVSDKCDNLPSTAQVVLPNSVTTDNWSSYDVDYYKVNVKRGKFSAAFQNTYAWSTPELYILDSNTNQLASSSGSNANTTIDVCADGVFYVKTQTRESRNDQYNLALTNTEGVFDGTSCGNPPSWITGATVVLPNSTTGGSIGVAGEIDTYKITTTTSGILTLKSSSAIDIEGYLYDSVGNLITYNSDSAGGLQFLISRQLGAGTYYVRVNGWRTATGAYSLISTFN